MNNYYVQQPVWGLLRKGFLKMYRFVDFRGILVYIGNTSAGAASTPLDEMVVVPKKNK